MSVPISFLTEIVDLVVTDFVIQDMVTLRTEI